MTRADRIAWHYSTFWRIQPVVKQWGRGPVWELSPSFAVLEFRPAVRKLWTYATCEMSEVTDEDPIELHLFSPVQDERHVELLTLIAHYHRNGERLGTGHTVNFGRPWLPGSACGFGLISLPYLDGPGLERFQPGNEERLVRCLWLVPITKEERDFKKERGLEELERNFETAKFNYADPRRRSVV